MSCNRLISVIYVNKVLWFEKLEESEGKCDRFLVNQDNISWNPEMQASDDYINIEVHVRSPKWDPDLPRMNQTWDTNSRKLRLVRFHFSTCL